MNISLKQYNIFSTDEQSEKAFYYTGRPERIVLHPGRYSFELYGANGGFDNGGKGGYVSATFVATNTTELFLYVGGRGEDGRHNGPGGRGGWNGGGSGGGNRNGNFYSGAGGGGATDIRTVSGRCDVNLEMRLIVAGGGGGRSGHGDQMGGDGGGSDGGSGYKSGSISTCPQMGSNGGKRDSGYAFGYGQNGKNGVEGNCMCEGSGGGGGGWFGGYVRTDDSHTFGGGGGSGYVSPLLLNPVFANGRNKRSDGNGYIIIRKLHSINSKRCPTTHHSLVLEAMLFLTGEFKGG